MTERGAILAILRTALEILEEANLPSELKPHAFAQIVQLLRGAEIPSGRSPARNMPSEGTDVGGKMAKTLGVPEELVVAVFDTSSAEVDLVVHRSKLPKQKAPAMKLVGTLVAAGRQAAGIEEWTSAVVIREVCRQFGIFDASNFAAAVGSLGDAFLVRGKGQSREFKVTRHGFEEAGRLVAQLGGGSTNHAV